MRCDRFERATTEGTSHACGGHAFVEHLSDDEVFQMQLGKFIDIVSGRELIPLAWERVDGQLDHIFAGNEVIKELVAQWMNDILAILHDKDVETQVLFLLEELNTLVDPVEAVGLVRWSIIWTYNMMDVAMLFAYTFYFALRIQIIRVCPDNHVIVLVMQSP